MGRQSVWPDGRAPSVASLRRGGYFLRLPLPASPAAETLAEVGGGIVAMRNSAFQNRGGSSPPTLGKELLSPGDRLGLELAMLELCHALAGVLLEPAQHAVWLGTGDVTPRKASCAAAAASATGRRGMRDGIPAEAEGNGNPAREGAGPLGACRAAELPVGRWAWKPMLRPLLVMLAATRLLAHVALADPQPGDVYREFSRHNTGNDWRVTDPDAVKKFKRAAKFLPNPRLTLRVDDLQGATRAELLLDRWGGHPGTINKRVRFNGNDWIVVPELEHVPEGIRPQMLMFQDNPVVPVPLEHLVEGENVFEGACDEDGGIGWGQWGVYSLTLRVYYDPETKPWIRGEIVSPGTGAQFSDYPRIEVDAAAEQGVARIDVLAWTEDYDYDGDGLFTEWQESRFQMVRGGANDIRNHVGTLWHQPYQLWWDTHWVPDQQSGAVQLIARIQDVDGRWFVTQPVTGLTLRRDDVSVQLYRATEVPEAFGVRSGQTMQCWIELPAGEVLARATAAGMHFRSWHGWDGHHAPLQLNQHRMPVAGKNHFYDYDLHILPVSVLRPGRSSLSIHSGTDHHQLEVLWPGPALVVRYRK